MVCSRCVAFFTVRVIVKLLSGLVLGVKDEKGMDGSFFGSSGWVYAS